MPSSWACGVPSSVTVVPSRSTVRVTGSPSPSRIDSARSSASPSVLFTATISSPGWRPAEAAGDPGTTSSTVLVAPVGTPSMNTTASARIANTRFVSGPAAMTATRLLVGARQ